MTTGVAADRGAAAGTGDAPEWRDLLARLVAREDLAAHETAWIMQQVVTGEADHARLAATLVGLRAKGETVAEVTGLCDAMLGAAVPLPLDPPSGARPVVDIVGTGGDGFGTVNISTAAAIVAAAAGCTVVKHGNRAASSRCGSADVLTALGVDVDPGPDEVAALAREIGVAFAFAQRFHPAMRHAAAVRRSLGIRTVFNLLGPLTNPARPTAMAVGVADAGWAPGLVAGVLATRPGAAIVFRGRDGLDELTTTTVNDVWVVAGGHVATTTLDTRDLGLAPASVADLAGGDAAENAAILRAVLSGEPGPVADVVAANAAAAIAVADLSAATGTGDGTHVVADVAADLAGALAPALERAREAMASGAAGDLLDRWVARTPAVSAA